DICYYSFHRIILTYNHPLINPNTIPTRRSSDLLSSHILSEVERLADRVAIIRQREIVESGTLDELRHLTRSTIIIETEEDVTKLLKVKGVFDFKHENNQATFSAENKQLNYILN